MYRTTRNAIVTFAALSLAFGSLACGDDSNGRSGSTSPQASTIDDDAVASFCEGERTYIESAVDDDLAIRAHCVFEVLFDSFDEAADPVEYCTANFDDCIANTTIEDIDEDDEGDALCLLEDVDRTNCSATVAEVRSCQRAIVDTEISFFADFTCPDLATMFDDEDPQLPASCQTVEEKCPQIFGGEVPSNNQDETNQTPANQNQSPGGDNTYTDFFTANSAESDAYYTWACECFPTEVDPEFTSESECLSATIIGDVSARAACIETTENAQPTPPASVDSFFACLNNGMDDLLACYDLIDGCSESAASAFSQCEAAAFDAQSGCSSLVDAEGEDWIESFDASLAASGC